MRAKSPGRAGYPLSSGNLTAEQLLQKAMQTKPPAHDPPPPPARSEKKTSTTKRAVPGQLIEQVKRTVQHLNKTLEKVGAPIRVRIEAVESEKPAPKKQAKK